MMGLPEGGINGVYYAAIALPAKQVFDVQGLYDGDGKKIGHSGLRDLPGMSASSTGLSKDGLSNPMVLKAWFGLINNEHSVVAQLATLSKKSGEVAGEATLLLERLEAHWNKQKSELDALTLDLETYHGYLRLAGHMSCRSSMKTVVKEIQDKLKAAAKQDPLKSDLAAYNAYVSVAPLRTSLKKAERDKAKDGLQQIAAKFPDSTFVRLAHITAAQMVEE